MDRVVLLSNPKGFCTEKYIRLHFPGEYTQIILCEGRSFAEKLYNYWYNDGKGKLCETCHHNLAKFNNIKTGYSCYCSQKCACSNPNRTDKIRQTTKERYGVDNVSQSQTIKDKKVQTCLENFGVEHPIQNQDIQTKIRQTTKERYGVDNVSQSQTIKDKKVQKSIDKYGVDCVLKSPVVKEQIRQKIHDKYGVDNIFQLDTVRAKAKEEYYKKCWKNKEDGVIDVISDDSVYYVHTCNHPECTKCLFKQFKIRSSIYRDRVRLGIELCTNLLPEQSNISSFEIFIRSILDKYNIEYQTNVRNIISPKELDIYIPSHHLAIECNGVYWHSSTNKESYYHMSKYNDCLTQGIQLLTFWEDQYKNKPDIIQNIILSKLGIYDKTLGARECTIKPISSDESSKFMNKYHIQGSTNSKVRVGLFYHSEIVSVMTFSHQKGLQGSKNTTPWVLDRFCVKGGWKVTGGADKLLKYFIKTYEPAEIISFACNDISNGNLYEKLGFKQMTTANSYWYIDSGYHRYHRSSFSKSAIVRKGWKNQTNNSWTESEVMKERGYFRIYDSGITKYVLSLKLNS